jgi:hypothetical protein
MICWLNGEVCKGKKEKLFGRVLPLAVSGRGSFIILIISEI